MSTESESMRTQRLQVEDYQRRGPVPLGPYTSHIWRDDPRHLGFLLARYKFAAKMLRGKKKAVDVGCGDAFGFPVLMQELATEYADGSALHGVDMDASVINENKQRYAGTPYTFEVADIVKRPLEAKFDAAVSLDVIEHIQWDQESRFVENIALSLQPDGILIVGTPNKTAERYASVYARLAHVNLKTGESLRTSLRPFFENVFIFGMNDEVVHAGYLPMAHYLIALCAGVRQKSR